MHFIDNSDVSMMSQECPPKVTSFWQLFAENPDPVMVISDLAVPLLALMEVTTGELHG
ncbi:hypothetical protein DPMN_079578 [Dreissena polymorpha]|uniref:Uncharacterized protein n=1 Tax=Dreissena polymorpha TaxID=45954 RepID=A0A9D4BT37_DREPO|nr:hypothetical protein DPMN_079578 [Dreissena polymorpha]